jgi:hypothetical protein
MGTRRRIVDQTPSIQVREVREAGILPGAECVILRAGDRLAERVRLQRRAGIDVSRYPRPMPAKPKWLR